MAEGVLFNVAEGIIGNLGSLAFKEIKRRFWGVKDELQKIETAVSLIKDVLLDAEEKQIGSCAVRNWLGQLEAAIYEADDLLDDFSTEALRTEIMSRDHEMTKEVRIFFSKSNQPLYAYKMAPKLKAIRERLDAIKAATSSLNLTLQHEETPVRNKKRDNTYSLVRVEEVFGREDDKKKVIERLMDSNVEENVSILPIVGFGGLGKTTLAKLIINDEKIKNHFELNMWVYVSNSFDVQKIVENILDSVTKKKPETTQMDTLVNDLREKIDGKKYLLVLDDVWNEDQEKWFHLKEVLMGGKRGSRILLTTRNESVARTIRHESSARIIGTVESYPLRGLDEDASWSLFKRKAFEKEQEPKNSSIVALGKEILKKCLGVPLAIRTIGSLLRSKNPETEWLSFKKNELSKISQNENDILPTLKLSYDNLPSHLKHCFAYCSLYPKDYKIDISTLIKLWIAQGFVKLSNQNQCLEDVGYEYFKDLLWRSFFQEVEMDEFGNIIQCKMHDLMRDLAELVAGSSITTLDDKKRNIDKKTYHVSFVGDCDAIFSSTSTSLYKENRIRTILCGQGFGVGTYCNAIFSSFKLLRVLDLRHFAFEPSFIRKLKHLRYLNLSRNYNITKLPDSISSLQNLQTLKLSLCNSLEELPRDISRLVNLRHLEIDGCDNLTYMPRGLGQLTNLQTLSKFVVDSGSHSRHSSGLQELKGLNNLRGKLEIENLGHGKSVASECKAANLKDKQHLQALSLQWSKERSVNDSDVANDEASLEGFQPHQNLKQLFLKGYRGSRLPSLPFSQLPSLKYLNIYVCHRLKSLSPSIQYLTALQDLALHDCPELEVTNDEDGMPWKGLTSLLFLRFSSLPKLVSLPSGLQHATTLQTLQIWNCESLTAIQEWNHNCESLQELVIDNCMSLASLPEGMGILTSLQSLTIQDCPILSQRCQRDTGEDWAKIAHIPNLQNWYNPYN